MGYEAKKRWNEGQKASFVSVWFVSEIQPEKSHRKFAIFVFLTRWLCSLLKPVQSRWALMGSFPRSTPLIAFLGLLRQKLPLSIAKQSARSAANNSYTSVSECSVLNTTPVGLYCSWSLKPNKRLTPISTLLPNDQHRYRMKPPTMSERMKFTVPIPFSLSLDSV